MDRSPLPHFLRVPARRTATCAVLAALVLVHPARADQGAGAPRILYVSPVPGARFVRPGSGLIVRFDRALTRGRPLPLSLRVMGSRSGEHAVVARLAADGCTALFQPQPAFEWGESVEVEFTCRSPVRLGVLDARGAAPAAPGPGGPARLHFTVATGPLPAAALARPAGDDPLTARPAPTPPLRIGAVTSAPDTVEPGYPTVSTTLYHAPAPGRLFIASFPLGPSGTPFLMIVGNAGGPVFARSAPQFCTDFKEQPDGRLTYYDTSTSKFYVMDGTYAVVDSFICGNDFFTDLHELRLLPNGHALLMGIDLEIVDMSAVVPGGNPAAAVSGLVIQELDQDKNVIFQWRSWDHFQITDATHEDLTAASIDYVHGNALDVDTDGNLLLSSRHLDEITKIDRTTGDVLWRLGGKNNQFTLVGDTVWFSHQHAIRRIANGDVTLFDNGNFHTPQYSRAVEYALDEVNMTARLVWQYRPTPDIYGNAMGYVQRLDNGSTLISWGTGKPDMIEVAPDGSQVMSLSLPAAMSSYRIFRQDWGAPGPAAAGAPAEAALSLTAPRPNPFRSRAEMFVRLPSPTGVAVRVVDVQGRERRGVASCTAEGAGAYRIRVDLSGLPAGVYFCRVSSAYGDQTRRLIHLE